MYEAYLQNAVAAVITARQAISTYNTSGIRNFKNISAYHTQQTVEFIVKYQIYNNPLYNKGKAEADVSQIYSHDIDYLITKYCKKYNIEVPKSIEIKAEMISKWEAESRYKLGFSARVTSIQSVLDAAEEWLFTIKPSYRKTILSKRRKYGR